MHELHPCRRVRYVWLCLLIPALLALSAGPSFAQEEDALPVEAEILTETELPPGEPVAPEEPATGEAEADQEEEEEDRGWLRNAANAIVGTAEAGVTKAVDLSSKVLFFDLAFGFFDQEQLDRQTGEVVIDPETGEPAVQEVPLRLLVMVLLFGGIFFTIWYGFINIRGLKHGIDIIRGKYTSKKDKGEVSPFRALTSALSATVGLGNIAGVAIAITIGGPGAVFWMIVVAFFGMSAKFSECALAVMFRRTNPDGTISGGPMYYIDLGLRDRGTFLRSFGKVLAVLFAVLIMVGAFGGGNMFQSNQSFSILSSELNMAFENGPDFTGNVAKVTFGIIAAALVGVVVLGGIRRIGAVTARLVPLMAAVYVLGCLAVLFLNIEKIPEAIMTVIRSAFVENAIFGGLIGVFTVAVQRAAFSNEAGLGSSAIAHAAARNKEPVREGLVAMMEPFIDTIVICTMTALVIVITGVYLGPEAPDGIVLTRNAFGQEISWFPVVLTISVLLFAYSTMISWCYYGERGWIYLMDHVTGDGTRSLIFYRLVFVFFVFVGALVELDTLLDLADMMILSMAFPNIVGSIILAPVLLKALQVYWRRYHAGEFDAERDES